MEELTKENNIQDLMEEGVQRLDELKERARNLMENRPLAVLAGAAALGFLTGMALRRGLAEQIEE